MEGAGSKQSALFSKPSCASLFFCVRTPFKQKGERMKAPIHLTPDTAAWWSSVMEEYALEPHHIRLLTLAAEAYDSAQGAREVLQREGKIFIDRFDQPKPRPEVAIQRDSTISFARLLRELDLDVYVPAERSRPPALVSNRA